LYISRKEKINVLDAGYYCYYMTAALRTTFYFKHELT
jgi:hypothetical protein